MHHRADRPSGGCGRGTAAALAAEEDARAVEQLRARLPYEVLNIGRLLDLHQDESTVVLSSLQGEVSKPTSLKGEVSKLTEMIANLTTQKSHPFSTPPPLQHHILTPIPEIQHLLASRTDPTLPSLRSSKTSLRISYRTHHPDHLGERMPTPQQ